MAQTAVMVAGLILEVFALVATLIGFAVAILQIYLGRREARASRDLEVTLSLSESFRTRWERSWRRVLRRLEAGEEGPSTEDEDEFLNMLNWVDWLGNLIDRGLLHQEGVVLDAIGPQVRRMLELGRPILRHDVERHGWSYWKGLFVVADRLKVRLLDPERRGG